MFFVTPSHDFHEGCLILRIDRLPRLYVVDTFLNIIANLIRAYCSQLVDIARCTTQKVCKISIVQTLPRIHFIGPGASMRLRLAAISLSQQAQVTVFGSDSSRGSSKEYEAQTIHEDAA